MKTFHTQSNVGKARHVVNYHDGMKTHPDGSPFFDIAIFNNERERNAFTRSLQSKGYHNPETVCIP